MLEVGLQFGCCCCQLAAAVASEIKLLTGVSKRCFDLD
jgi:hypothetical protein